MNRRLNALVLGLAVALAITVLSRCSGAAASGSRVDQVASPLAGYTCFAFSANGNYFGGSCVKD